MKSFATQTHYEVLEISVGANAADVKSAFERLSNLYAEDQIALYGLVDPATGAALHQRLKEAFDVLSDDARRDAYDAKIGLPPRAGVAKPKPAPVAPRAEPVAAWSGSYTFVTAAPAPSQPTTQAYTWVVPAPRVEAPAVEPEPQAPQLALPLPSAPVVMTIEPRPSAPPIASAMEGSPPALAALAVESPVPSVTGSVAPVRPPSATDVSPAASTAPVALAAPASSPPAAEVTGVSPSASPVMSPPAPSVPVVIVAPAMSPPVAIAAPAMSPPAAMVSPPVVSPAAVAPEPSAPVPAPVPSIPITVEAPRMSPPAAAPPPSAPVVAEPPRMSPPVAVAAPIAAEPEAEVPAFAPINEESAITITRAKEYKAEPRPKPYEIPEGVEINGDLLRQVRMARGITLAQLSDRMRVSVRHLENVEGDRYGQLPAGVYLRGILMNLARELGLDGLRVSRSYLTFVDANRSKG